MIISLYTYVPVQGLSPVNNCDRRDVEREILSSDMQTNLQFIGSLPNNIIKQVNNYFIYMYKQKI